MKNQKSALEFVDFSGSGVEACVFASKCFSGGGVVSTVSFVGVEVSDVSEDNATAIKTLQR